MLDACVLYPTVMREVLIGCAEAGLDQRERPRARLRQQQLELLLARRRRV